MISIELETGGSIVITTRDITGNADMVSTTYPNLVTDVEKGNQILIDDGNIEFSVTEVSSDEVKCKIVIGGVLKPHKGMNLPGTHVSAPAISAKDLADIEFAVREGVDLLALSFVRSPGDVTKAIFIENFQICLPL